ncbi:protein-L-isoaspartate(D-aspartate) O-methyltransferase [Wenzhouxiangella sp. XN79A]|uniref:protein-L-isoaspartate(D-aspartate) O-methyltransferase n=1 Tax=Wenzhouxiangella sp. XN79A TaxID=2724193 RepID=UPI00144AD370|nr:protein-L-isoaspartate(D-aspartate) O-methyltransferase [Wenzhouxiangella sp. XN79A]NKI34229.1 protein-L-isoaspartate(D-aspartate) O-methyltransferase [Wenzhouxiangella sp. XN79A]
MNAESLVRGIGMTSERTRRRLIDQLRAEGIVNETVLEVIARTPRHLFVDEALSSRAYENSALPIGRGQTISQPLVVARMTEAVLTGPRLGKVLEVGTGSGYQAAILAQLADQVFTTERIGELARQAKQRLHRLKLHKVFVRHLDGRDGWPSQAPFDAILVTAGGQVPDTLYEQLAEGGVLVAPVGEPGKVQHLERVVRTADGLERETLGAVSFVPLLEGLD